VKRVAAVIGLRPDSIAEYEKLHADVWPAVLEQLARSSIDNYSIYRYGGLLFSYYEYGGDDLERDLAAMAADPATREWWALCEPLQLPVPERADGEWWHRLDEVFHCDIAPESGQRSDASSSNPAKTRRNHALTSDTSDV
jgi:L-rhamnose mutarotase